ncbi:hypothetical protein L3X38_003377 [Prunus dulcis]|uniref:Mnd1 HTH domain-containing protein n=1 Tax=Prunus dulcis TaxID=3755 RepID=A0AAD4ZLY3_PRUDU|nr:hypothetical protein L3X38_003377 [Prunus dulcis]
MVSNASLKELEKSGPKKGVISQPVKDVIQSLVDDELVFKDKIGTSVSRCFHIQLCIVDDDQCIFEIFLALLETSLGMCIADLILISKAVRRVMQNLLNSVMP